MTDNRSEALEQLAFIEQSARDFAQQHILPHVMEWWLWTRLPRVHNDSN